MWGNALNLNVGNKGSSIKDVCSEGDGHSNADNAVVDVEHFTFNF